MIWETVIQPFAEFAFMRRALLGCIAISVGATPVGVFLMLRRMSLTGDAMAHAILPGAAVGYLVAGLSLGRHRTWRLHKPLAEIAAADVAALEAQI